MVDAASSNSIKNISHRLTETSESRWADSFVGFSRDNVISSRTSCFEWSWWTRVRFEASTMSRGWGGAAEKGTTLGRSCKVVTREMVEQGCRGCVGWFLFQGGQWETASTLTCIEWTLCQINHENKLKTNSGHEDFGARRCHFRNGMKPESCLVLMRIQVRSYTMFSCWRQLKGKTVSSQHTRCPDRRVWAQLFVLTWLFMLARHAKRTVIK